MLQTINKFHHAWSAVCDPACHERAAILQKNTMKQTILAFLLSATAAWAVDMTALNNRLILDMPAEAKYGERGTALMAAYPGDDETLIWVGDGDDRIAVYAQELDVLAGKDFEQKARTFLEHVNKKGTQFEIKSHHPDICYSLRKDAPKEASGQDLFGAALIRHKDGSLLLVRTYFAANQVQSPEQCRNWSEKAFLGIRFGEGTRPSAARTDTVEFLEVPVPEGYVRTINPGVDFVYTTYRELKELGTPGAFFGIYVGAHPSYEKRDGAKEVKGTTLGQDVTWSCYESESGFFDAECLVQLEPPLCLHLLIAAPSAEVRDALIKQLSQIKLANPDK